MTLQSYQQNCTTGAPISNSYFYTQSGWQFSYAATWTPTLSSLVPATVTAYAARNVTLYWAKPAAASAASTYATLAPSVVVNGGTSLGQLVAGNLSALTFTVYGLPAGLHAVQVLVPGYGLSAPATLTVPLTISSALALTGSTGGGLAITIAGSGFSTRLADNTVVIDTAPCVVTAATASQLVCVTSPHVASSTAYSIYVTVRGQ